MTSNFVNQLSEHLAVLYPDHGPASELAERSLQAIGLDTEAEPPSVVGPTWSEGDVALITYGDSVLAPPARPLEALRDFVDEQLGHIVSMVHVLPFFPFSSDDGFSVIDFAEVREDLGGWDDIAAIGRDHRVMADLIVNHASASSSWFQQFLADELPGRDYFVTVDPDTDLTGVVRPRTSPLLRTVETASGQRHVWATFSHDQLDLDFANPAVLMEFLGFINQYLGEGVRAFRLDAVGYLWKEIGTSSIHLPQTHRVVKLIRLLLEAREPDALLITETNVPHAENVSYFGDAASGDEAHLVYNFTMPPLVLQALLSGQSAHLKAWIDGLEPLRPGTSFFNFLASHDGIGLRPTEGILSSDEIDDMVAAVRRAGGLVSMFTGPDGAEHPYELNISLFEAMRLNHRGVVDGLQIDRFVAAHALMLAFVGLPAFYIHSLLASPNDLVGVAESGAARSINRARVDRSTIDAVIERPGSDQDQVLRRVAELVSIRTGSSAFHPEASQSLIESPDSLVGIRRTGSDGDVVDVYINITAYPVSVSLPGQWHDLLSDDRSATNDGQLMLGPYGSGWIRQL